MNRRQMLSVTAAALVAIRADVFAAEVEHVQFEPAAYDAAIASGEPLLLDFFAPW